MPGTKKAAHGGPGVFLLLLVANSLCHDADNAPAWIDAVDRLYDSLPETVQDKVRRSSVRRYKMEQAVIFLRLLLDD